ncbi:Rha family transcriptional regulator [Nocardia sp. NPDC056611]|uniref:Rha family transcriptional regulator n=1 Tax=Nocardia sp. NPDC056611 TaxID=3345877 RepID=UPI003672E803
MSDGVPTTTSLIVAEGTQNAHASVLRLIRGNLADFEEFGLVGFEIRKIAAGPGRPESYAVLNEEHATLLLTYMRNSVIVKDFKKRLVREFWALKRSGSEFQPNTVTWMELAALIRQRYGISLEVADITRALRDGGVLMQNCSAPKKAYRQWFWFTGSAWTVHPHVLPELVRKLVDTRRALGDMQSQLRLDLGFDEQLRREIETKRGRAA